MSIDALDKLHEITDGLINLSRSQEFKNSIKGNETQASERIYNSIYALGQLSFTMKNPIKKDKYNFFKFVKNCQEEK